VLTQPPGLDRLVILVPTLLQAAFFFALGASVASFVNVIAWRWPRGQGIVNPPSRCSTCGRSLQWWENIPILSWIALRGRCRSCGVRIGCSHVLVELGVAALFAATVVLLYGGPFTERAAPDATWWTRLGAWETAPALLAVLSLWGCLIAASLIDAETGYIPLGITSLAMGVGLVAMTAQGCMTRATDPFLLPGWPTGFLTPMWVGVGLGGLIGVASAAVLLWKNWLPRSFATIDPIEEVAASVARKEVMKEFLFLALPLVGCIAGGWLFRDAALPAPLAALGASALGLLVGAATIWLTRIFGTLAFGREAMGLGDVHLMAAAGCVIGWRDSLITYLLAPFLALIWVLISGGLAKMRGKTARELPYGPHLALACMIVFLLRPWVVPITSTLFGLP